MDPLGVPGTCELRFVCRGSQIHINVKSLCDSLIIFSQAPCKLILELSGLHKLDK